MVKIIKLYMIATKGTIKTVITTSVKVAHREKAPQKINSSAYKKYQYGHLGHWYIKLTLFKRL